MSDDVWDEETLWDKAIAYAEALDREEQEAFNHGDLYESIDIEGKQ